MLANIGTPIGPGFFIFFQYEDTGAGGPDGPGRPFYPHIYHDSADKKKKWPARDLVAELDALLDKPEEAPEEAVQAVVAEAIEQLGEKLLTKPVIAKVARTDLGREFISRQLIAGRPVPKEAIRYIDDDDLALILILVQI